EPATSAGASSSPRCTAPWRTPLSSAGRRESPRNGSLSNDLPARREHLASSRPCQSGRAVSQLSEDLDWRPSMRKAVSAAVLLAMAFGARLDAHPLSELDAASRAESQASDLRAVVVFREGLAHLVDFASTRPDLFPAARRRDSHLLNEVERVEVRETWKSFLDYVIALDSLEHFHADYALTSWRDRAASFHVARGAFIAQYRFALDFIQRVENDRKLAILLNDPMPELGLPAGSYDRFKFSFLNVAASSQLTAYGVLARLL